MVIEPKPILKPKGGRRLKSAVTKVKIGQGKEMVKKKIDDRELRISNKQVPEPGTAQILEGTCSDNSQI